MQGYGNKENTVYLSTCRLWRVSWASGTLNLWIGWNGFRQTSTSRFNVSISFQFFLLVISTQVASDDVGYVMRRPWVCQKVDRSSTLWTRILLYIWFQPWMGQWVCHVVNMLRSSTKNPKYDVQKTVIVFYNIILSVQARVIYHVKLTQYQCLWSNQGRLHYYVYHVEAGSSRQPYHLKWD